MPSYKKRNQNEKKPFFSANFTSIKPRTSKNMSDGNFNRSLLPHTPYHSGLQTGKAMERQHALEAFKSYLQATRPDMTEEDIKSETERFRKILSARS